MGNTKIYVSAELGNDDNTGLEGSPFRTITKALSVTEPLTDIMIAAGTYYGVVTIRTPQVRLIGVGAKTVLQGIEGTNTKGVVFLGSATGSALEKVKVTKFGLGGLKISANNVRVADCSICYNGWGIAGDAFGGAGILTSAVNGGILIRNHCYRNREHGIYVSGGADNFTVRSNYLNNNGDPLRAKGGNGLQVNADGGGWPSKNLTIYNNVSRYNYSDGFSLQGLVESQITSNEIDFNGKNGISLSKGSRDNVIDGNEVYSLERACIELGLSANYPAGINNTVTNNELWWGGARDANVAISYYDQAKPFTAKDNTYLSFVGKPIYARSTSKKYTVAEWQALGFEI